MLYVATSLLTWDVLLRPSAPSSAELTFRLVLGFLLLIAGLTAAFMLSNK